MNCILLTGANGFLGSHLLEALLCEGYRVIIFKRENSNLWRIEHLLKHLIVYDIDLVPLEKVFNENKIDIVIHTACKYGRKYDEAQEVLESNLIFGVKVLNAALKSNVETFINTDTFFNFESASYKYMGAYSLSKKQFLEWLKLFNHNIQVINMKLQHVYGPKDNPEKFVPWLIEQLRSNIQRIPLTKGSQCRDFIYVEDVVSAYLLLIKKRAELPEFSEFEVGTGVTTALKVFTNLVHSHFKSIYPANKSLLGFGDIKVSHDDIENIAVNNSALICLGWTPLHSITCGIKKVVEN